MICGLQYFIKKIDVEKHVNISIYFEAQFGPKIKIHPVVARGGGGRGTHLGVLYLQLLSTDIFLCMPSFMLLT